jgi:lambda repressor-like predicted transcriptional regulator
METIKTIRGFHWITKIVIALTLLLLGLLLAAGMIGSYWMSNQADVNAFQAYQGLSKMAMSLAWVLTQAFLVILVIIAVYMAVTRVQAWIERYLDAMVVKMDNLSEQKSER